MLTPAAAEMLAATAPEVAKRAAAREELDELVPLYGWDDLGDADRNIYSLSDFNPIAMDLEPFRLRCPKDGLDRNYLKWPASSLPGPPLDKHTESDSGDFLVAVLCPVFAEQDHEGDDRDTQVVVYGRETSCRALACEQSCVRNPRSFLSGGCPPALGQILLGVNRSRINPLQLHRPQGEAKLRVQSCEQRRT